MKYTLLFILIFASISCCKETVHHEGNTFCGAWYVSEMDSITKRFNSYQTIEHYHYTDTILFQSDSVGSFSKGFESLSRDINEFNWSHDRITNVLRFSFDNGETEAYIKRQVRDTIELMVYDYLGPFYIGTRICYYMKLEKID